MPPRSDAASNNSPAAHPNDLATDVAPFLTRWQSSGASERANYALFLSELCDILTVPRPEPTRPNNDDNAYVFERFVSIDEGDGTHTTGRIDLYKRGCFVLEAKQGAAATESDGPGLFGDADRRSRRTGHGVRGTEGWDQAMEKARGQAERYVRALPAAEGNPPFILVVDVGHTIELYADFSRLGKTYTPFPDARSHRIPLADLAKPEIRARLAAVWTDPLSLDPTRRTAKVTREVADRLAKLARSFEDAGHHAETVAEFLMRCIFTFFAEDVKLIKDNAFTKLLESLRGHPEQFPYMVTPIWQDMCKGSTFNAVLRQKILHFNGGLFEQSDALAINEQQLELLIQAAKADWSDVEPAIFGTLLERALSPEERHKLGAHYTPRAYVERLVLPTVIEPLREQFDAAKAAAFTLNFQGKPKEARGAIGQFLNDLANTIVLDPACGSGNFLYVTMDHMKRLEEEARDVLRQLGQGQEVLELMGLTVDPHQFLGLEINPRAVAIADLVLWIGYLQFHYRARGGAEPAQPVLRAFHNIKHQDAVLAYDAKQLVTDEQGKPVTQWDGKTKKTSPVTGEEVPDESARVPVYRYVNPRKAEWPKADYVVGNPPFIGNKRMRLALGDGYVESLRAAHHEVPETVDFVVYWWDHAAILVRSGAIRRFGFITTNTLTQTFNRQVVQRHLAQGVALVFAIQDHPWVDSADGAAVRIAMAVGAGASAESGIVAEVVTESDAIQGEVPVTLQHRVGRINAMLTVGADVSSVGKLRANERLSYMGVILCGDGFFIDQPEAIDVAKAAAASGVVAKYISGTDLAKAPRGRLVIDLHGLTEVASRAKCPAAYQWVLDRVKPVRMESARKNHRTNWWIYGESRPGMREALRALPRFVATARTAKFRVFQFLDRTYLAESNVIVIASSDACVLGVLSSKIHITWSAHAGATLEDRPHYTNTTTFEPFPFPAANEAKRSRIRELAESLDAHRKRQQSAHPELTITDMYNVLSKLRSGEALSEKDKRIHEQGLASVLKQIHDDLDAAVADAYGWPVDLPDDELLRRLVALNAERAAEEKRGLIRWLRPEFQNPGGAAAVQTDLHLPAGEESAGKTKKPMQARKPEWPKTLAEQARAIRAALTARPSPATAGELAKAFSRAPEAKVAELLEALATLGQARAVEGGRYAA